MAKLQKKRLADLEQARHILNRYWGYTEFRPLQEEIIGSVAAGRDTLALMPTGGGKSITFQVPSLALDGICIVVTPLIALMRDQVEQLTGRGIKAAAIHSGMTRSEILTTLDNCLYGGFKFLYVSPERLGTDLFRARVAQMDVNLLAVDEAHCISQWGYDFRPSYLEISHLRELLEGVPVLALTATATPEVCDDIQEKLRFSRKNLLKMSFDRPNLAYVVRRTEDKTRELVSIARRLKGCGIVYARSRKKCRELALLLKDRGMPAEAYHAGMTQAERDDRQRRWTGDAFRIMVATNAFGMGIDKPDVRFVVHVDLPDNPESYFQEAGRAGRDGEKSYGILLYSGADRRLAEQRIEVSFPGIPKIREIYMALCNFLQVPLGSGKGQQFDFELGDFLARYRLSALVATSALNILAREGYIAITEAIHNPSRVMFRVGRDDLYNFQVRHADFDNFIKLLLRSYSGLFTQYVMIDESLLARRSGIPREKVYTFLKSLSSRQIIHYIPRKDVPVITFLEERLDEKNLFISPERYHFRQERFKRRIGEMLRYATTERICRNQYLLSYFGELRTRPCGRCDVCLSGSAPGPGAEEFRSAVEWVKERLSAGPLLLEELVTGLPEEAAEGSPAGPDPSGLSGTGPDQVLHVVEWLMDRGWVEKDGEMRLSWSGD